MDDRFIKFDEDQEHRQELLQATRKPQDVLNMLSEECGELVRAAQKLRRALDADETMPFTVIGKVYRGGAFDYYIYDVEYDEPVDGPWPHYTKQHRGSFSEDALELL